MNNRTHPTSPPPVDPSSRPAPPQAVPSQPVPLRVTIPRSRPVVTWILLGINILVWLEMTALGGSTDPDVLIFFGAKYNPLIVRGEVWRLITPLFLHIGLLHLASNMYAIYIIAPQVESFFGQARFLCIYLFSGIFGVLLSFMLSSGLSAGASGAIFGLIGTRAAFFFRYRDAFGQRGQRQFYNTLSVIAINLIMTFTVSGIDIWGHIGGLLAGIVLGWYTMPRYKAVMTDQGPKLIDQRTFKEWGIAALLTALLLAAGTWAAILLKS